MKPFPMEHLRDLLILTALVFGPRYLPPSWKYFSSRKRRAMRFALREFDVQYKTARPCKKDCSIYKIDDRQCIVRIPMLCPFHPPIITFYGVADDTDEVEYLGSGQCHWGIRSQDIWEYHKIRQEDPERAMQILTSAIGRH